MLRVVQDAEHLGDPRQRPRVSGQEPPALRVRADPPRIVREDGGCVGLGIDGDGEQAAVLLLRRARRSTSRTSTWSSGTRSRRDSGCRRRSPPAARRETATAARSFRSDRSGRSRERGRRPRSPCSARAAPDPEASMAGADARPRQAGNAAEAPPSTRDAITGHFVADARRARGRILGTSKALSRRDVLGEARQIHVAAREHDAHAPARRSPPSCGGRRPRRRRPTARRGPSCARA